MSDRFYPRIPKTMPERPNCVLGLNRRCGRTDCTGCGWDKSEIVRRKKRIERVGLTMDHDTGLRRLIVTKRTL